jgi:hypothetical protein
MNEKNNRTLKSMSKFLLTVMVPLLFCSGLSTGQARLGRVEIPFKGNATGGKLVIGYIPDPHSVHTSMVSIDTSAGESADSAVNRLATAVTSSDAIFSNLSKNPEYAETMRKEMAQGSTLSILGLLSHYILAGTETGLGIPKPPLSLSCSYNNQARTIDVRWINPSGICQYDSLRIIWRYKSLKETLGSSGGGAKSIWDTPTNFIIKVPAEVNDLDTDIWIKGLRHEMPIEEMRSKSIPLSDNVVPSNATAIHLTSNGYGQEETYGIPFFAGVAPNWTAWGTAARVNKAAFEQGDKYAGLRRYEPVRALLTKPFYQIIKAPPKGAVHGVYRKFLGLTPRHSYRLTACLTTLDMDSVKGDWSLCLCATHNGPGGEDLTTQQLAGQASLPDGTSGPGAGRIAYYGPRGDFELVFSGERGASPEQMSSNITLPAGVDTITVWVRFRCSDRDGKVGFSGVKLEDISAISNPKSPEQIVQEEDEHEMRLMKWIERNLREESP